MCLQILDFGLAVAYRLSRCRCRVDAMVAGPLAQHHETLVLMRPGLPLRRYSIAGRSTLFDRGFSAHSLAVYCSVSGASPE